MTRVLAVLAVGAAASGGARAGEPNAAELAAQIDRHIEARLETEGIRPAELADDAAFLRRVYLDLHGVIPTAEQAARFLTDGDPARRQKLIDALLASDRYGEYLADQWRGYLVSPLADDYRVRSEQFRQWLAGRFNTTTWDRIATELLTATGKLDENPAVSYLIEGRLPRTVPDLTDLASRYFLGIRLSCAQCHDHPFVPLAQRDFWGMAAFFTQVQTPGRSKLVYQVGVKDYPNITLASLQETEALDGFMARPPTFLGGSTARTGQGTNRAVLAAWLTAPDNPYFARAMVNRTWWRLFGRGLVNPVDDMHSANPPSHPELLDLLSRRFIESGFDLKFLTQAIVSSRAYQRTSRPGSEPEAPELFNRMAIKVLSPGQLYDSLVTAFGPPPRLPRQGPQAGTRPEFTQFFADDGDPDPTAYRRGIPHLLRLMNSAEFTRRNIPALAAQVARPGRSADEIAGELFLTILSRRPTADELRQFQAHVTRCGSAQTAGAELAWALMLTSEFSLNH